MCVCVFSPFAIRTLSINLRDNIFGWDFDSQTTLALLLYIEKKIFCNLDLDLESQALVTVNNEKHMYAMQLIILNGRLFGMCVVSFRTYNFLIFTVVNTFDIMFTLRT